MARPLFVFIRLADGLSDTERVPLAITLIDLVGVPDTVKDLEKRGVLDSLDVMRGERDDETDWLILSVGFVE